MSHFGIYLDQNEWFFLIFMAIDLLVVLALIMLFVVGRYLANKRNWKRKPSLAGLFILLVLDVWVIFTAIPNFFKYAAKDKRTEAKTYLAAIYIAQQSYFSDANTYASGPDAFNLLKWESPGQNRYAYYCQGAMIPNKLSMRIDYTPMPDGRWPVTTKPQSSKTGFTCMAVGNVDDDSDLDVWSINDAKILRNDQSDV